MLSLIKKLKHYALSCNLQTLETFRRKSTTIKLTKHTLTRYKFGKLWYKWQKLWKCFIKFRFCIEIWSALMFFVQKTPNINWEILMFRKLLKGEWPELRQEPHTIPALRYGTTERMTQSVIFGLSDALFTKWPLWIHHSEPIIWNNFTLKFRKEFIQTFLLFTRKI